MQLAIDTSNRLSSVALVDGETLVAQRFVESAAETLVAQLDEMLHTTQIPLRELQSIAVVEGPGSFTGLRVGFSVAKTLGRLYEIPVYGVSSLLALVDSLREAPEFASYTLAPIIHSSRAEFYICLSAPDKRALKLPPQLPPQLIDADKLFKVLPPKTVLYGMGIEALLNQLPLIASGKAAADWVVDAGLHTPSPLSIARLASQAMVKKLAPLNLSSQPNYLRASEAERRRGYDVKAL